MTARILVVDDDESILYLLETHLESLGYETHGVTNGQQFRQAIQSQEFDSLLMDYSLPDGDGISLMKEIHEIDPEIPVIIITAHSSIEMAVEAMRQGAYDFSPKPIDLNRLTVSMRNALEYYSLKQKVRRLEQTKRFQFHGMIGGSSDMQIVYRIIENVAPTNAPVFITGESGTGKELVAQAVHKLSSRYRKELVDVNCAAIPQPLLESELFGHERNAFTGAHERYIGRCERAHKSTLFLDEVAEMDISLQPKILRFLEDYTFYRVGGKEKMNVDVRIVSATNQNPLEAIKDNRFREDLYYRLNVVNIHLPPLRERPDDIPELADHFLQRFTKANNKFFNSLSTSAIDALCSYSWPGNIRELVNCIQQAVVLHDGEELKVEMLPQSIQKEAAKLETHVMTPEKTHEILEDTASENGIVPIEHYEKYAIEQALQVTKGNVAKAAAGLHVSQATLYRKVRDYDIVLKQYKE